MQELANALDDASTTASSLELNLLEEFYVDANTAGNYIEIKEGTKPVEIHGSSTKELTVGVWVQRDDLTLDGIKINITDSSRVPQAYWSSSGNYHNAILLGKGAGTYSGGASLQNVKVIDSAIKIAGNTGFTSGIYVGGTVNSKPSSIEITGNKITAKGDSTSAVQALLINFFDKGLTVTDNELSATYGSTRTSGAYDAPASAFFINKLLDTATTNESLNISGNTLSSEQYNFYINVFPENGVTTSAGVDALREKEFSLPQSKWSFEDATSFAKVVFDKLVREVQGKGFAAVLERVETLYELEQYEINSNISTNNHIEAINYYGDGIANGQYSGPTFNGRVVPGQPAQEGASYFNEFHPSITIPIDPSTRSFKLRDLLPSLRARRSKVPQLHPESYYD
ncbi:MAG: hypothetical protein LBT59_08010 [Clostridiales bacterium]|nr:hypothetical protein [Clostridiales bacterium]